MATYPHDEIEEAFRVYWRTGAVHEDWDAWADLFTEDVVYIEHVLGHMQGREAIRKWIKPTMDEYGEIYTAYEWHTIDAENARAIVYMQNRRDHPSGDGTIDFPGITILDYAGNDLWSREEDFWAVPAATKTLDIYADAMAKHDPEHKTKRTRKNWGSGPDWTRGADSYATRPGAA
jgi:ketosteroid isomerase-like protein